MRRFCTMLVLVSMFGCQSKYKYIEVGTKTILGDTEPYTETKEFTASHDTAAYEEAYSMFQTKILSCKMTSKEMKASVLTMPTSFAVIDEKGNDLSNIFFLSKESKEKKILEEHAAVAERLGLNKKPEEIKSPSSVSKPSYLRRIDEPKVKSLSAFFDKRKDEYSNDDEYWYKPKSAPKYINRNAVYCYFQTSHGQATNFRFVIQYAADDWIFYKKALFSVDGVAYSYTPLKTETDNGSGGVWEWSDESVGLSDMPLIEALALAKKAKMKLVGSQYHKEYTLTQQQLLSIKQSLELYKALGGI